MFELIAGIIESLLPIIVIIVVGVILWLFAKPLLTMEASDEKKQNRTIPSAKPGNSGNATNKTGAQTTNAHGNRHTDLIATRALIQKWQNDGSISDAEFAKLSGLVSREQAALESVQVAEPVVPTPKPIPLSQFKVESTDEEDSQAPIVLSKYSVNETDQTDDDSAESDSELVSVSECEVDESEQTDDGSPPVSISETVDDSQVSEQDTVPGQSTPVPTAEVLPAVAREVSAPVEPATPVPPKRTFSEVMSAFMESRNVRWFEFIAGISIIGSTIGLVATLHVKLKDAAVPYLTALLFMAFVAAIVGVGVYVIKRLKLPASGRATLLVGALLLPINFIAATVLEKHDVALTDPYFLVAIGLGVPALGALGWVALKHINRDHWVTYWIALMGPSFAQVIVKRVVEAANPGAFDSVWNVVGIMLLPLIPMVTGVGIHLKKMAQLGQDMTRDDAYSVFELLGLGIFSVCSCGFLLFHFGTDQNFVGGLATPLLIIALTVLAGGMIVHKGIVGEELAVVRTVGSWLMVTGGAMALLSIVTAWPEVNSMLLVAATALVVFILFGVFLDMPLLMLSAVVAGAITTWLATLSITAVRSDTRVLIDYFFWGPNAINFLVCSVIAGVVGGFLKSVDHKRSLFLGAGLICAISVVIAVAVSVFESSEPLSNLALVVFMLTAIGAFCAIAKVKHHAIWMVASGLVLAFWAYFTHSPWIQNYIIDISSTRFEVLIHGVTTTLMVAVIGLKVWESRLSREQREDSPVVASGTFSTSMTGLLQVATVSMIGGLCLTFLKTYLAQHEFATASLMMMLSTVQAIGIAVSSGHKKWYAMAQIVTILLAITCTSWATFNVLGDEMPSLFSWEILRIQVLVQSFLMIGWFVLRKAAYLNAKVARWVKPEWMYVDYIVQGLNTLYFLINILIVLIPQVAKVIFQSEFYPVADAFLHPGDIQIMDWIALSSILISWITVIPDRYRWAPGLGVLTTIAMLPMLIALGIKQQSIVDLILMWGYGFFALFAAITLSTRQKWFGGLEEMFPRLMEDTVGSNQQIWALLRRVTSVVSAIVVNGLALSIYAYLLSGEQFRRPGADEGLFLALNPQIAYSVPMFLLMASYLIYAFDLKRPSQMFNAGTYWYFGLMYVVLLPLWEDENRINYTELLYSLKWSLFGLASFALAWSQLVKWKPTAIREVASIDDSELATEVPSADRFFKVFYGLTLTACAGFVLWSLFHGLLLGHGLLQIDSEVLIGRIHPYGQFADLFSVIMLLVVMAAIISAAHQNSSQGLSSSLLMTVFGLASLVWHGWTPIGSGADSLVDPLISLLTAQSNVLVVCIVIGAVWVYFSYADQATIASRNGDGRSSGLLRRALAAPPTYVMSLGFIILLICTMMLSFERWMELQSQLSNDGGDLAEWTGSIYFSISSLTLLVLGAFLRRNRFLIPAVLITAAIPIVFHDKFGDLEVYQIIQLAIIWLGVFALVWKLLDLVLENTPALRDAIGHPVDRTSSHIAASVYTTIALVGLPALFYAGISVVLVVCCPFGGSQKYISISEAFNSWDAYLTIGIAIAAISVWSSVFKRIGPGILSAVGIASIASLVSHTYGRHLGELASPDGDFDHHLVTHAFIVLLSIASVVFVVITDVLTRKSVLSLDAQSLGGVSPSDVVSKSSRSWFAGLCLMALLQLFGLYASATDYTAATEFHFTVVMLSVMSLSFLLYGAVIQSEVPAILSGVMAITAGLVFALGVRDEVEQLLAIEAIVLSCFSSLYLALQWIQKMRATWPSPLAPTRIRANHVLIPSAYVLLAMSTSLMIMLWVIDGVSVDSIAGIASIGTVVTVLATLLHLWDLRLTNIIRRTFIGGLLLAINLTFYVQPIERIENVELMVTTLVMVVAAYSLIVSLISMQSHQIGRVLKRLRVCSVDDTLRIGGNHVQVGQFSLLGVVAVAALIGVLLMEVTANRFVVAITPVLVGLGLSFFRSQNATLQMRFQAWLAVVFGVMLVAIASLPPGFNVAVNVERIARIFVSLAGMSAVVLLVDRFAPSENLEIKKLIGSIRSQVIKAGIGVFALLLAFEIVAFNSGGVQTPPWLTIAVCAAVATIVFVLLVRAVQGSTDGRKMSDRLRQGLVYLSEILVVGIFAHVYLVHPDLFSGIIKEWWAYIMMALAFIGAYVAQRMHDRGLPQISEPLFNTSFLLPVIPLVGVWMLRQQSVFDYSFLLSLACLANVVLGLYRKSFFHALAAALAGNGSLWVLMSRFESWSFADHPQFWIIPPALSVLVAAHLNKDRLKKEVLTMIRYLTISTVYLSSGSEVLLHWSQDGSWQKPLILMLLGIAGAFAGVIMRIRAFLFLGTAFTVIALCSMIVQYAIDNSIIWWISGITIGVLIWSATIWWEKRKQDILPHIEKLQDWDA